MTLARARELREDAKRLLRDQRDPSLEAHKRKIAAHAVAGATFEKHALLWHEAQRSRWSPVQVKKVEQALRRDVFPDLGRLPLAEIDGPMILKVLRKVERRGAIDTAKRIRHHSLGGVPVRDGRGLRVDGSGRRIKKGLLPTPQGGKQPAVRTREEARNLLAEMDASSSAPGIKLASRLLALTATRRGVVRAARWTEFEGIDWNEPDAPAPDALWRVPPARMAEHHARRDLDRGPHRDGVGQHLSRTPEGAADLGGVADQSQVDRIGEVSCAVYEMISSRLPIRLCSWRLHSRGRPP